MALVQEALVGWHCDNLACLKLRGIKSGPSGQACRSLGFSGLEHLSHAPGHGRQSAGRHWQHASLVALFHNSTCLLRLNLDVDDGGSRAREASAAILAPLSLLLLDRHHHPVSDYVRVSLCASQSPIARRLLLSFPSLPYITRSFPSLAMYGKARTGL